MLHSQGTPQGQLQWQVFRHLHGCTRKLNSQCSLPTAMCAKNRCTRCACRTSHQAAAGGSLLQLLTLTDAVQMSTRRTGQLQRYCRLAAAQYRMGPHGLTPALALKRGLGGAICISIFAFARFLRLGPF